MPIQNRRERERRQRHQMIIDAARELAETDGWDAVTTRRLADRVEYSQPVLYSHFPKGKAAIVAAVAIEGIGELARKLRAARTSRRKPETALRAVAEAYLDFAEARPALYEAMFVRTIDVAFGTSESPAELRDAFGEILAALRPFADGRDLETLAEVFWSSIHGFVMLTRGRRLRPDHQKARLDLLVRQLHNHAVDTPRG